MSETETFRERINELTAKGFFDDFEEFIVQRDENSCALEFECVHSDLILNKDFKAFLDYLEVFFSDYQLRVTKSSGHKDKLQVWLRLEERLWKPK